MKKPIWVALALVIGLGSGYSINEITTKLPLPPPAIETSACPVCLECPELLPKVQCPACPVPIVCPEPIVCPVPIECPEYDKVCRWFHGY